MSPSAGDLLVEQIAPRLRVTIPKVVQTVGAEDAEELVQDAIVVAAQMLDRVERQGKTVTAGNIAYYAILHMKSGRRSYGSGRTDTLATATQLDHKSGVLSLEEEVGCDPETGESISLGELLASNIDDPAMAAGRNLDWDQFLGSHDYRYGVIVGGMMEGRNGRETADRNGRGFSSIYRLRNQLAADVAAFMGEEAISDAMRAPRWRATVTADREKTACRADRRRRA